MSRPAIALAALLAACAGEPRHALAHGGSSPAREGPWSFELIGDDGRSLPTFEHRGRTFVLGHPGERYRLRVHNGTGRRIEVVASVDGLDVIDGRKASWDRRGYLVEPWGAAVIDGFRLDAGSVAAFRFGSVASSYAASKGDARDVGVIGVAVFPERVPPPPPPWRPRPYRDDEGGYPSPRSEAAPLPPSAGGPSERRAEAPSSADRSEHARPGLGTRFGERHGSEVHEVPFERASGHPAAVLTLRYDDRRGLLAAGVELDRWGDWREEEAWRRDRAEPFRGSAGYSTPPPGWRGW